MDFSERTLNGARTMGQLRLSRIILLVLLVLVTVPLVTHYYLSKVAADSSSSGSITGSSSSGGGTFFHRGTGVGSQMDGNLVDEFGSLKSSDLKMRIDEMLRIKASVSTELRELEARRRRLQMAISNYSQSLDDLKADVTRQQMELDRLKLSVDQARVAQKEALQRNTPELAAPRRILPSLSEPDDYPSPSPSQSRSCRLHLCFDFSRCSLTSGFPVYVYSPDAHPVGGPLDSPTRTTLMQTLGYNPHVTLDPSEACLYLVLVGDSGGSLEQDLLSLPYWRGDGRNHVLFRGGGHYLSGTGRAMVAQVEFGPEFRPGFDLVMPPITMGPPGGDVWGECPPIVPARRRYLMSFQGEYQLPGGGTEGGLPRGMAENVGIDMALVEMLKRLQFGGTEDRFYFQFGCGAGKIKGEDFEWTLCQSDTTRASLLRDSTYALILTPSNQSLVSTQLLQVRLHESLKYGAIPVVLGSQMVMPFGEFLDWNRAAIFLPKARITELHFLLRAIPDADLLSLRRQGRFLWERYMASVQAIVDTTVAVLRDRIGVPALPAEDEPSPSIFNATFVPLKMDSLVPEAELDESLGPMEPPYPSPIYQRNYTAARIQSYELWNEWGDPFHLHQHLPYDPILPSEAKFLGSGIGFRPIGRGSGGAGKEFSEALGGNMAREQFTIVMLTYEREQVLMNSLARLFGLPYLNKVVVVWNSPRPPPEDLRWPDIGVPVHVVKAARNSLNNRFLPYSAIETEAVLSVDDDAHLRHDEIMFGFRVWREHRDRLVGFPGRYHAWDLKYDGWLYNSNYSCELSMVLTGAAFFHKYYAYLYSYTMPQAIRDKVDEYMNCEDIAMNFLVSHVTRKPPVKVTSRWTFRCPGCPVSLSEEDSHFQERHKCINFFTKVYGYTPLLNTQYRADSILFKTRIPHDKQKCFKFI